MTAAMTQDPVSGKPARSIAAIFDHAQRESEPVALGLAMLDGLGRMQAVLDDDVVQSIVHVVGERLATLTPETVVHWMDGRFVLICPDAPKEGLTEMLDGLLKKLRSQRARQGNRFVRLGVSMGVAFSDCPSNPRSDELLLDTLVGVASEGLDVARANGGGQWVHTELYGLVQGSLERREPGRGAEQARRIAELRSRPEETQAEVDLPAVGIIRPSDLAAESALHIEAADTEEESGVIEGVPALDLEPNTSEPVGGPFVSNGDGESTEPEPEVGESPAERRLAELMAGGSAADRDEFVQLMLSWIESERARASVESKEAYENRISILERRIEKLNSNLSSTESELQRLARVKAGDSGVASMYREVQGLSTEDDHFEMKKALMVSIFEANVELRTRLRTNHG